jgi:hypothetical protein
MGGINHCLYADIARNVLNILVKDLINMVIYVYDYFDFCYFMSLFVFVVVFW